MGERNINLIESNSNCYDFSHLNDFRQLDVHLLHYLRLDRYDLYRFEKKAGIHNLFCSCRFEKKYRYNI